MDTKELLDYWQVGTRIFHMAHHRASAFYARMQKAVGMSVVILTTTLGTTLISDLGKTSITIGLLSVGATVLAALQTFLNLEGRAEQHRAAALKYGMLRRRIELVLVDTDIEENKLASLMEAFRTDWDLADKAAPILPQRFYDQAKVLVTKSIEAARKRREKL